MYTIIILSGLGIVMMYSASSLYAMNKFDNYMFFLNQQFKWLILGYFILFIFINIDYKIFKKIAYLLLISSWIIMIMGFFFKGNNPASRWLIINGKSWMTTSDLARISLIIFTSFYIDNYNKYINDWKFLLKSYTPFLLITLSIILYQPDTSTTITIFIIIITMLFIANTNWKYLATLISLALYSCPHLSVFIFVFIYVS